MKKKAVMKTTRKFGKQIEKGDVHLGTLTIKQIRDVDMCELDLETDQQTFDKLADMGLQLVKTDRDELFGYAVRKAVEDCIKKRGGILR
jgi:hypothetical protein